MNCSNVYIMTNSCKLILTSYEVTYHYFKVGIHSHIACILGFLTSKTFSFAFDERESWHNISWSCCDGDIISAMRVIIHKRDKMSDKIFQEFWGTHNCSNTLFIFILRVNVWVNCSIIVKWEAALCFKAHGDVPMYL